MNISICPINNEMMRNKMRSYAVVIRKYIAAAMAIFSMTSLGYATPEDCKASPNEGALLACRKKNYKEEDAELARLIKVLHDRFADDEPERASALTKAQTAWKTYRDSECAMRTFESKGTGYQVYLLDCLYNVTHLRVVDLKAIADNP